MCKDDKETLYDIEVQTVNRNNLPKRMRFYQSLIDREQMPSGEFEYNSLLKTIIIFVTDFDPFKKGLYRYTFENTCKEDCSVTLGDESLKVVLNTQGKEKTGIKPELIELLEYFHSSTVETAEKPQAIGFAIVAAMPCSSRILNTGTQYLPVDSIQTFLQLFDNNQLQKRCKSLL